jgi:alanyl-tRNA synthetase
VEALTGEAARLWMTRRDEVLKQAAAALRTNPDDVPARVATLAETVKRLEKDLAEANKAIALGGAGGIQAEPEQMDGFVFLAQSFDGLDPKDLRSLANDAKGRMETGVVAFVTLNDGRASVLIGVTDDLTSRFSAVDLVRGAVEALGGQGGGGKPDMAQGGGPDGSKIDAAFAAIKTALG